ncbi:MAG: cytochrome P450 [Terrimicrobiaceae bacterium]
MSVDVTTNLAFGYDMNTLEKEGDVIQQHLEKIFPMIDRRINAMFPYWRYFKLPADRALDKSLAVIRETIAQFIAQARERLTQAPERWLEEAQAPGCAHNTRAFVPFGAGPRFCPGRQLAMMEIKTVMAMLCTGFEVSKADPASLVNEIFAFTMMPENLLVRFHRRRGG